MVREWVTVKQYAEHLKTSQHMVCDMIRQGFIPATKVGNGYRIDSDGADKVLLENNAPKRIKNPVYKLTGAIKAAESLYKTAMNISKED